MQDAALYYFSAPLQSPRRYRGATAPRAPPQLHAVVGGAAGVRGGVHGTVRALRGGGPAAASAFQRALQARVPWLYKYKHLYK